MAVTISTQLDNITQANWTVGTRTDPFTGNGSVAQFQLEEAPANTTLANFTLTGAGTPTGSSTAITITNVSANGTVDLSAAPQNNVIFTIQYPVDTDKQYFSGNGGSVVLNDDDTGNSITVNSGGRLQLNDGDSILSPRPIAVNQALVRVNSGGELNVTDSAAFIATNGTLQNTGPLIVLGTLRMGAGAEFLINTTYGLEITGNDARVIGDADNPPRLIWRNPGTLSPGSLGNRLRLTTLGGPSSPTPNDGAWILDVDAHSATNPGQVLFIGDASPNVLPQQIILRNGIFISHNGGGSASDNYILSNFDARENIASFGSYDTVDIGIQIALGAATDINSVPFYILENAIGRQSAEYPRFGINNPNNGTGGLGLYQQDFSFNPEGTGTTISINLPSLGETSFEDGGGTSRTVPASTTRASGRTLRMGDVSYTNITANQTATLPVRVFFMQSAWDRTGGPGINAYRQTFMVDSFGTIENAGEDTKPYDSLSYGHVDSLCGALQFDVMSLGTNNITIPTEIDVAIDATISGTTTTGYLLQIQATT